MHREGDDGRWRFGKPDPQKRPGCAAVWDAIAGALRDTGGEPVPVHALYDLLTTPPYGVRPGLVPVFLVAFAKAAEDEVAFYENGTLVQTLRFEVLERLLKSAEKGQEAFAVQWVEIRGARAAALAALAPLVGLPGGASRPLPVALRILKRVHALPPFVRKTATLSDRALAVREALQGATDPKALLFRDLPAACGAGSLLTADAVDDRQLRRYAENLRAALRELGGAYAALLDDVMDAVARAFRLRAGDADGRRAELAERARALLPVASDARLKAFLVRATDQILDTQAWFESLAALLAKRPPEQWTDEDRASFATALRGIAQAFFKLEPLAHDLTDGTRPPAGDVRRVRLFVQTLTEQEEDGIVHVHPEDDALVDALHVRLAEALPDDATADVKLAALGRLAAELLHERRTPAPDRHA